MSLLKRLEMTSEMADGGLEVEAGADGTFPWTSPLALGWRLSGLPDGLSQKILQGLHPALEPHPESARRGATEKKETSETEKNKNKWQMENEILFLGMCKVFVRR